MRESLKTRATQNGSKIEEAHYKGIDNFELDEIDSGSLDRASFKEEAIEMQLDGWRLSSGNLRPTTMYNQRSSPGVNYIRDDGF